MTRRAIEAPRQTPYSEEAEMSVLGGMMNNVRTIPEALATLSPENFYFEKHRFIFEALGHLFRSGRSPDFVTVSDRLRETQRLDDCGGMAYVGNLVNDTPGAANVMEYAKIVKRRSQQRHVLRIASDVQSRIMSDDAEDLMAMITDAAAQLMRGADVKSHKMIEVVDFAAKQMALSAARRLEGGVSGAPIGLHALDRLLGGFHGPRLYIVAARPKCAKSALLNQFAIHSTSLGHGGVIFTRELHRTELAIRGMAYAGQVSVTKLHRGYQDAIDIGLSAISQLGDLLLWLDDATSTVESICASITLHKIKYGIKWAAVDHIGLVRSTERHANRNEMLGHISWSLKECAKNLDIPIIALCQLGRDCDKEKRRPRPDDLRDSGNIEQDADAVIMLHTPVDMRDEPVREVLIGVPANRTGPSIWLTKTPYLFTGSTQTFSEATRPDPSDYQ